MNIDIPPDHLEKALTLTRQLLTAPGNARFARAVSNAIRTELGLPEAPDDPARVFGGLFGVITPPPPAPLVTPAQILTLLPHDRATEVAGRLNEAMRLYEITTPLRAAHFLAQLTAESSLDPTRRENLDYTTPERLMQVWPSRFLTAADARLYVRNPEGLANYVYGGRMGNTQPGDGWRYRGAGLIQLTGRNNYRAYGSFIGVDLEGNPELAATYEHAFMIAACFWHKRGCNRQADADDVRQVTTLINGGLNGLESRKRWLEKTKRVLGVA